MSWYDNYIENIAQGVEESYREEAQAWMDDYFSDSTLCRTIQEEEYPFNNKYNDYLVHVDSVAEISTNVNKIIGDFISVVFKDCDHINYRGQKYLYDNETYLCYDKINKLARVAKSSLIRCNNEISWLDENGNILSEKVFVGYELSSTNDNITKKAIVSNRRRIIFVQCNEKTNKIKINQRFMFQHNQCFRVEEIDNYYRESNTDGDITLMKLFLVYSPLVPNDNVELNICDYYNNNDYELKINQDDITQVQGFKGKLTATVISEGEILDKELSWLSDSPSVTIDKNGNYELVGEIGDIATITCCMTENNLVNDSITIEIVDDYLPQKKIVIEPSVIEHLNENKTQKITCYVAIEGEKVIDEDVTCVGSEADSKCYKLTKTVYGYDLKNIHSSEIPLILTFSANGCDDITMDIMLDGLF